MPQTEPVCYSTPFIGVPVCSVHGVVHVLASNRAPERVKHPGEKGGETTKRSAYTFPIVLGAATIVTTTDFVVES